MDATSQTPSWEEQKLLKFSIRRSGGKSGAVHETVLEALGNGKARLLFCHSNSHGRAPETEEFLVDEVALDEIKAAFLREEMPAWFEAGIPRKFVADKESTAYRFTFSAGELHLSAQIFPESFTSSAAKLTEVIERARSQSQQLLR